MTNRYTTVAILLHWLIAFAIFGMFAFGWYMTDLPKEAPKQSTYDLFDLGVYTWELAKAESPRAFYYNLHKSFGITLLGLIIFRLIWRITHKAPAMLSSYKAWERKLATGAHHLLYLLMLAIPLSGFIMSINSKYGVKWFGIKLFSGLDDYDAHHLFEEVHEVVGQILLLIVIIHVLGALKHKFIDKDETLSRILP